MQEARERTKAAHSGKTSSYARGDLVWVRTINHGNIKWIQEVIEQEISSASYEVVVQGRICHVSSSHLRRRSPMAWTIGTDPRASEESVNVQPIPDRLTPETFQSLATPTSAQMLMSDLDSGRITGVVEVQTPPVPLTTPPRPVQEEVTQNTSSVQGREEEEPTSPPTKPRKTTCFDRVVVPPKRFR
ncbi:hypothetical protein ABEB36_015252 [Hypothenemus hampei]|uniref:Uncharacterized protein n=1 Tax=Hypothenemus hampei TaxID=57062 RepID=A0ABD1E0U4_HYPHA